MSADGAVEARVRAFDPADIEDLVEVFRQPGCVAGTLQMPYREPEQLRDKMRNPPAGMWRLVAEVDDGERTRVVGICFVQQGQDPRRAHTGYIGMMVHDRWQGHGIGTRLMEAVIDLSEAWLGLTRLELTVYVDNAPAIRLYEKCGFEVEGRLRRFARRDGEWVDSLSMARLK